MQFYNPVRCGGSTTASVYFSVGVDCLVSHLKYTSMCVSVFCWIQLNSHESNQAKPNRISSCIPTRYTPNQTNSQILRCNFSVFISLSRIVLLFGWNCSEVVGSQNNFLLLLCERISIVGFAVSVIKCEWSIFIEWNLC